MDNRPDGFYKKNSALVWLIAGIIVALIAGFIYNVLAG
jgi:hypothetical protein